MRRAVHRPLLLVVPILMLFGAPALAQQPFADSARADAAARVVAEFVARAVEKGIDSDNILDRTTGRFTEKMKTVLGEKLFPAQFSYEVTDVLSVRPSDSVATVVVASIIDTLTGVGPLNAEMIFLLELDSTGWRIADMRRFKHIEKRVAEIAVIDTSKAYPRSLKPHMIRELSSAIMSNDQLRENYLRNESRFADLVSRFTGRDSLRHLGRIDRSIVQLNRVAIDWGVAAHHIPQEAIDEYLASASSKERNAIRAELRHAERLRTIGRDSLARHARRYGLSVARLDSTVELMSDLRVSFINAELPWNGAVQLTVGGFLDDAIGYIYSPSGEIPIVSNEEYYYLEPIADGWWIFRAG